MNVSKVSILLFTLTALSACSSSSSMPSDATQGEVDMAEMMGITVEELRNQTPEEHMRMMQDMMQSEHGMQHSSVNHDVESGTLPADIAVDSLPVVQPTETINVADGDSITLNPTLVQKQIGNQKFAMLGYNSQIPGPIIRAPQGATITVNVTNNTPLATTVHWHGLRHDNKDDGVPDITQPAITPESSYSYQVSFPDDGVYWYHPHVREDVQQDHGLYGNLIVDPSDTAVVAPVNQSEVLVLDDLLLDEEGMIVPHGNNDANFSLMGRFGNVMLVNGQPAEDFKLSVDRGAVVRFYITNVANTRTFNLKIDGGAMKRIGSDVGRYEQASWVESITIAPAERYIVDVLFEDDGQYPIIHESPLASYQIGTVVVNSSDVTPEYSESFSTLQTHTDVVTDVDQYRKYFDRPVDKTLELDIEMGGPHGMMDHGMMMDHDESGIEWEDTMPGMNAMMTGDDVSWILRDADTGAENMDINWQFAVGDVVKVRVINLEESAHPMQHPVHFHGQRFLILDIDGKRQENFVWKDTILVPTGTTVDLLVDMSNPGEWMFHCHIAEHLTNGMMGSFTVQ